MVSLKGPRSRKATWLAFGLVTLAVSTISAQDSSVLSGTSLSFASADSTTAQAVTASPTPSGQADDVSTPAVSVEFDQPAEAARAYRSALVTLSTLTAIPPSYTHDSSHISPSSNTNSFLSAFLPNPQGQGPLGSAIRIAIKLRQQFWLFRVFTSIGTDNGGNSGAKKKDDEMRGKAIKVIDLLQHSAELGSQDALYTLGQISLFPPNYYFPSDPAMAYDSFSTHASLSGNASSQALLAFFYATGYHDVVPINQAKAQLYYTFAALGGHKGAQMALGYRYWSGIGTLEDCGRAVDYYEIAAEQAMSDFLSGPPGGKTLPQTATRLSDLHGGIYGPGASVASTGLNLVRPAIKAGMAHAAGETWDDVLEYYLFNADRGEIDFAYKLGKIFYQGSIYASAGGIASGSEGVGSIPRDYQQAQYYFLQIARQVWPRDPPNPLHHATSAYKAEGVTQPGFAAKSAGYLGRMYLRGEGVEANPAKAMMWFERGAEYDDRECHNGLGILWRDGLVQGKKDLQKALQHFNVAAGQELPEAQVNVGKYHYYRGELKLAATYFETAVRHGSQFEAHFYLALIHNMQTQTSAMSPDLSAGSCATAVSFHKMVAERGVWDDDLLHDAEEAWLRGADRDKEVAILKWWIAAERGFEVAQNNLAFVLDQDKSILRLTRFSPIIPSNDTARLALTQWTRSAAQRNVDALVKVGDYYYHGLGVPEDSEAARWEKAAKYYQSAADTQVSALAMWNLGWMYENGAGVPQDYHLAKRHYDMALETNGEAYLPVMLSLVKLYMRSFWHTLGGGSDGLSLWSPEEDGSSSSVHENSEEREGRELDGSPENDQPGQETESNEKAADEPEEDGPWYFGKAKEEFHRRRRGQDARANEEEDPVQWARDRRNSENERDGDFGPEDYFDGALRGGHRGEEDVDDFAETMLLVALCLAVSILLYVRTRFVERVRREERQQGEEGNGQQPAQPPPDLGAFPGPDDPARNEWNILH
ncbi:hypothetical protein SERLA73DRAFT_105051 [Serpula lacrymans var. lacrymans S7.3]|uniref:HCP-like protein n=2 Tax=Serpula lacrymans var. lacrymans TaxID=341189 RepID=F8PS18_SERL3|nr:uncharacterized protein SERLADRAFT_355200 [Serpula lacrymans var. lacrymans S7.9]EGO00684.1 hypothetical protein SERLA73DRAFT_105051 [Serpula lacrymans var. lacrymans S7.3]EGO26236.1 hypothetical protein SERLADRAFT_355200 [Serpula lacrymans var. lacrymans S7.9]